MMWISQYTSFQHVVVIYPNVRLCFRVKVYISFCCLLMPGGDLYPCLGPQTPRKSNICSIISKYLSRDSIYEKIKEELAKTSEARRCAQGGSFACLLYILLHFFTIIMPLLSKWEKIFLAHYTYYYAIS